MLLLFDTDFGSLITFDSDFGSEPSLATTASTKLVARFIKSCLSCSSMAAKQHGRVGAAVLEG